MRRAGNRRSTPWTQAGKISSPFHDKAAISPLIQPDGDGPWNHVRRLAALPLLARLNYVTQLSTTNIGLNIGATHNRLAHLIGTMDLAARILQVASQHN
jgi:hypothetical protein